MVQGKGILVIDFGNSSTKGTVLFGKSAQTGRYRRAQFEVSNVFAPIDEGYEVSADYDTDSSTIMRVDALLEGRAIKGCFCNGELQQRERPFTTIKPGAFDKKYNLDATVLSVRLAFLQAYKAVMEMHRLNDPTQVEVSWQVVTLLPPGDIDVGREPMTELIKGVTSVESVYPVMKFDVTIDKVTVLAEGFCGYVACIYDEGQTFRRGYEYLMQESVLIFDIGAGTTDCMIVKDNKLVQASKHTVQQGGNNVFQLVRRQLRLKGIDIDEETIRNGVIKGYVKDGSKQVDIVDMVNNAKAEVAGKIIADFQDYLALTDIKMRSVGYILACGGGSMMDSECTGIKPLSEKILESVKQLSPNAELVSLPRQVVNVGQDDGTMLKEERPMSARFLNLIGASILAEVV